MIQRTEVGGNAWLWEGHANGHYVSIVTTDPELQLEVRPILTPWQRIQDSAFAHRFVGAELVDQHGHRVNFSVHTE